jgi:hypothetical protein
VPTDTRAELWTEGPAASDSLSSSAAVPAVTLVPTNEYRPKAQRSWGNGESKQTTNQRTNKRTKYPHYSATYQLVRWTD